LKNATHNVLIFALAVTFLTLLVVLFPTLNYLSASLRLSQFNQERELRLYAKEVEKSIYAISPIQKTFIFPRSILYKGALLDTSGRIVFSLIEEPIPLFEDAFYKSGQSLFYKQTLLDNPLHVSFLVVQKELSYSQVIFDSLIMIGVVLTGMFVISFLLMKMLLKPYIETSARMNLFFTDVMHELKTPLGIMQLNIEGLNSKYKDKRLSRSLAALSTLATLYDDLEYLIKNKTITYTHEYLDFSIFLEDRISYFESLAASKEITLLATIAPELFITMNRIELQRLIDNNLTNAIKYSHPKSTIEIFLYPCEEGIVFEVKDYGIGIKEIDKIFTRHYRGDIFKGGFGIGLSIVKSICDKYDIAINVESKVGEGSRFSYRFLKRESLPS